MTTSDGQVQNSADELLDTSPGQLCQGVQLSSPDELSLSNDEFPNELFEDLVGLEEKAGEQTNNPADALNVFADLQRGIQDSLRHSAVIPPHTNAAPANQQKFFTLQNFQQPKTKETSVNFDTSMNDDNGVPKIFANMNIDKFGHGANGTMKAHYVDASPMPHQDPFPNEPQESFQYDVQFVTSCEMPKEFASNGEILQKTACVAEAPHTNSLDFESLEDTGVAGRRGKLKDPENIALKKKIRLLEDKKSRQSLTKSEEAALHRLRNNLSCRESRQYKNIKDKQREENLKKANEERDLYKKKCDHSDIILNSLLMSENVPDNVKTFINQHRMGFS